MKKKILALALAVALIAVAVTGFTLSYFKDTKMVTNVMTVGDLEILLHEDNNDGLKDDAYREWLTEQAFLPTVTLEKDAYIENKGSNDAYVRMFVVYPETMAPMLDIAWDADLDANWISTDVSYTVYGVKYVGRCLVYNANEGVLEPGKITTDTITSVTLLQDVECNTDKGVITYTLIDANDPNTVYTHTSTTGQFPVLVYAQAGQVANGQGQWSNATEALNVMFGTPDTTNPWAAEIDAAFEEAIANGEVTVDGITLTEITEVATSVTIDGTIIKNVGDWAGSEAANLEEIVFTEGVESLGYRTFKSNTTLKKVVIPASMADLGSGSFQGCTALETVILPEGLTVLPENTFYVSGLPEITLPESLTSIEKNSLRGTQLETITIPANVTYIGEYAFRECPNLKTVYILGENVTFDGSMIFSNKQTGESSGLTIYVKNEAMLEAAKAAVKSSTGVTVEIKADM